MHVVWGCQGVVLLPLTFRRVDGRGRQATWRQKTYWENLVVRNT